MKKGGSKTRMRRFTVVIEQDEDGYYVASVPSLASCYTQARTLQELAPRIREVIALCLAEQKAPRMKFIALEQVEVAV
jgi:predicted RNase H-like HicB family nuclease